MPVTVVVLLAACAAAGAVWLLSRSARYTDPIDPATEERWLVGWLKRHPRFGSTVQAVDHQAVGGVMVVIALVIVFATALGVGLVFDMVDRDTGLARADRAVAEWGSAHATAWSTNVLDVITDLGGTLCLAVVATVIATIDYLRYRNANVVLFLLVVLAGIVLINNGLKEIVDRERPDVVHLVGTSGSSFPSGHSSAAAAGWCAIALVAARHWPRRQRAIVAAGATLIAVSVAASRALLGVHWLTDVVAGTILGWGWFLLCALAFGGRIQRLGEPADWVAVARGVAGSEPATATTPPPR